MSKVFVAIVYAGLIQEVAKLYDANGCVYTVDFSAIVRFAMTCRTLWDTIVGDEAFWSSILRCMRMKRFRKLASFYSFTTCMQNSPRCRICGCKTSAKIRQHHMCTNCKSHCRSTLHHIFSLIPVSQLMPLMQASHFQTWIKKHSSVQTVCRSITGLRLCYVKDNVAFL